MEEYIKILEARAKELKTLHSEQVDDRKNISIATRSGTLGRIKECQRVIKELKKLRL